MARKKFKDIKFPGLPNTYFVPEIDATLSTEGATADAKAVGDALDLKPDKTELEEAIDDLDERKAEIDGYYETLTSGQTEQIIATEAITDTEPYIYRRAGGRNDIGDRAVEKLVGGSVVWNQLMPKRTVRYEFNDCTVESNGDGRYIVTVLTDNYTGHTDNTVPLPASAVTPNHVYLWLGQNGGIKAYLKNYYKYTNSIFKPASSLYSNIAFYFTNVPAGTYDVYLQFIDLTAVVTPLIADYIYTLETANAGDGVAWFRKYFPGIYYEFCEPHFEHVQVSAKNTVGFNQWDEEWEVGGIIASTGQNGSANDRIRSKNYIPCFPNTAYYFLLGGSNWNYFLYDADKNYIGCGETYNDNRVITTSDNARYIRFLKLGTTYNHDICINLHGDRDGEYEAYKKRTYPLDSSLTLRGIPKLDSANRLYFDGDIYRHDGSGESRYNETDLGTLNWSKVTDSRLTVGYFFEATVTGCLNGTVLKRNEKYPQIEDAVGLTNVINVHGAGIDKVAFSATNNSIYIVDSDYSDAAAFKTAMSGIMLVFRRSTPEPFTAEPFQSPMVVDPLGTEEFVDYGVEEGTRDVAIPCGHNSEYPADLRGKLQHLPSLASADGRYVVVQAGNQMTLSPDTSLGLIAALEARVAALEGGNG